MSDAARRVGIGLLASLLLAGGLEAQGVDGLVDLCVAGGDADVRLACTDGALAGLALQHGYGLLMGAGGPVPASPGTAGQRLEGSPRWVFDAGTGWAAFRRPDLADPERRTRRSLAAAPRLTVAAGLFEGFSPAATVGGVAAVDLIGEVRLAPVPAPDGLSGRAAVWGLGTRIGVVRESFSLPGVTLSLMHRRAGTFRYGTLPDHGARVRIVPNATSLRAVAGKDLWEIGVSGGVQRDRIRGDASVSIVDGGEIRRSPSVSLPADRTTWFVGLNRTWVVAQVTGELGWSPAPSTDHEAAGTGPFGSPGSAFTGALSFRITY